MSPSFQLRGISNADLVIFITANSAVCSQGNSKVLTLAYSCIWDQFERPIVGTIDFCLEMIDSMDDDPIAKQAAAADGAVAAAEGQSTTPSKGMTPKEENALKLVVGMAVHEIARVLGMTSEGMLYFYDSNTGHPRTPQP